MLTAGRAGRAVATCSVVLLALPACEVRRGCDDETKLEAEPVRGSNLKDLVLRARLTSEGKPAPGEKVGFTIYASPDKEEGSIASDEATTDDNGVASYYLSDRLDSPFYRENLQRARSYKARFDPIFGPLCGSTDRAPFEYRP